MRIETLRHNKLARKVVARKDYERRRNIVNNMAEDEKKVPIVFPLSKKYKKKKNEKNKS